MGEPIQSRFGNIAPFHHTHTDVPKVFVQPDPPTQGMVRGDIWIKTQPIATTLGLSDASTHAERLD